jgi:hypothetical protein
VKKAMTKFLVSLNVVPDRIVERLADDLIAFITTPQFSALYDAQRTHPSSTSDLGLILNRWRTAMSAATDAMAAAITTLQNKIAAGGGVTAAEVNTQITAAITPLTTQIQTILASEDTDESKVADITAELAEFTTAFAPPASSGSGASSAAGASSASGTAAKAS